MTAKSQSRTIEMTKNANGTYRVAPTLHYRPASVEAFRAIVTKQMALENYTLLPLED